MIIGGFFGLGTAGGAFPASGKNSETSRALRRFYPLLCEPPRETAGTVLQGLSSRRETVGPLVGRSVVDQLGRRQVGTQATATSKKEKPR